MWLYSPPYRSTVEQAAIERVFFNAYWRALRRALRRMEEEGMREFS